MTHKLVLLIVAKKQEPDCQSVINTFSLAGPQTLICSEPINLTNWPLEKSCGGRVWVRCGKRGRGETGVKRMQVLCDNPNNSLVPCLSRWRTSGERRLFSSHCCSSLLSSRFLFYSSNGFRSYRTLSSLNSGSICLQYVINRP